MGTRGKLAEVPRHSNKLTTPSDLSPAASAHWRRVAAAAGQGLLTPADAPLLVEFCRALALADECHAAIAAEGLIVAGRQNPSVAVLAQQVKSIVALAARLRLCPQSRHDRITAGTMARNRGPFGIEALSGIVHGD